MHALLLASAIFAAPVPKELNRELPPLTPGAYSILWGTTPFTAVLDADGGFWEASSGKTYSGVWSWDAKTRTLGVDEVCDQGGTRWVWTVKLDAKLSGTTCGGVAIKVEPFRPPAVMPGK